MRGSRDQGAVHHLLTTNFGGCEGELMRLRSKITAMAITVISVFSGFTAAEISNAAPAAAATSCNGNYVSWVEYYWTPSGTKVSYQPTAHARAVGTYGNGGMWNDLWRCTPVPWRNFMLSWSSYQIDSAWDQMVCHNRYAWWFPGTYDLEQQRPRVSATRMVSSRCNP